MNIVNTSYVHLQMESSQTVYIHVPKIDFHAIAGNGYLSGSGNILIVYGFIVAYRECLAACYYRSAVSFSSYNYIFSGNACACCVGIIVVVSIVYPIK